MVRSDRDDLDRLPARQAAKTRKDRAAGSRSPEAMPMRVAPSVAPLRIDLEDLMTHDGDVESFRSHPGAFRWTDGLTGRRHRFEPDYLVRRCDGTEVYRHVRSSRALLADRDFGGRRRRIELECRARGAGFEVWTERELNAMEGLAVFVRAATVPERKSIPTRPGHVSCRGKRMAWGTGERSPLLGAVMRAFLITELHPCGTGWIGRSDLTGIDMAILCDLETSADKGLLLWKPQTRRAGQADGVRGGSDDVRRWPFEA